MVSDIYVTTQCNDDNSTLCDSNSQQPAVFLSSDGKSQHHTVSLMHDSDSMTEH